MHDGQQRYFTIGGFRFRCTMWEQPDTSLAPCVVLPGLYQTAAQVSGLVKSLLPHMTCIVIEPPGLLGTDDLPLGHGPLFLAGAVREVIDRYGSGPVNLMSISAGTPIGYLTAVHFPDRVLRAAFIGFARHAATAEESAEAAIRLLEAGRLADWADMTLAHLICQDPGRRVRGRATIAGLIRRRIMSGDRSETEQMIRILRRNIRHLDWFPGVGLRQPALFFTGEHDTATPPATVLPVAALCADARVTTVRESDHMVLLQRPAEAAELVVRHCSGGNLEHLPYCTTVEYFGSAAPEATSSSSPAPA